MKTIFWNVDTQYDFMRDDADHRGRLAIPGAWVIEAHLARLTNLAKEYNFIVINTADWHTHQSAEFSDNPDFIKTFPPHCLENTIGAEFVPATKPKDAYRIDWRDAGFDKEKVLQTRNIILYKDKFGVFDGTPHADGVVKTLQPDRAIVYGVATNVCVDYAVRGFLERNIRVYVPTDAIKELPGLPLPYDEWKRLGAQLTTTVELRDVILSGLEK